MQHGPSSTCKRQPGNASCVPGISAAFTSRIRPREASHSSTTSVLPVPSECATST
ncbi:hypothetical protein BCC0191_004533 [Burkholderia ambifaria]